MFWVVFLAGGLFKVTQEFDIAAGIAKIIKSEILVETLGAKLIQGDTITPLDSRIRTATYIIKENENDVGCKISIWHNQDYSPPMLKIDVIADGSIENKMYQTIISILGLNGN